MQEKTAQIRQKIDQLTAACKEFKRLPAVERDILLAELRALYLKVSQVPEDTTKEPKPSRREAQETTEQPRPSPASPPHDVGQQASASPAGQTGASSREEAEATSLNERLKHQREELMDKLQQRNFSSLHAAIGVNERYAFVRELFDGDREAFQQTIEQLRACDSLQEAEQVLDQGPAEKYGWQAEDKKETASFLKELVKRTLSDG